MKMLARISVYFVLSLLAAEGVARFLGFGHPLLYRASASGYELVPNQVVARIGKTTHINSIGTRGPDVSIQPAPNALRILTLGDSVANGGTQVSDAQTWPAVLEGLLKQRRKDVEIVNASAGGWSLQNEYKWIKDHGIFGSKLILLEINEKDLDQGYVGSDILDNNVSFPTKNPPVALGEVLFRYVLPRLGLSKPANDPGSTSGAFQPENTGPELRAVEQIRELAAANGARLTILYWDLRIPAPPEAIPARDRLFAFAGQHDVPVIRPEFLKRSDKNALFYDEAHPNAKGDAAVAKFVAEHLTL